MAFVPVYPEGDDDEIDSEAFWLGQKSAVIGSSKGDQFGDHNSEALQI